MMALKKPPDDDFLLALLVTQLRNCKALQPAFVIFDGAPEVPEQRTSK